MNTTPPIHPDRNALPVRQRIDLARDWMLAAFLWIYALLVIIWCVGRWGNPVAMQQPVGWRQLPSQLVMLTLLWLLVREMPSGMRCTGWLFIGLMALTDLVGTVWWIFSSAGGMFTAVNWAMLPYFGFYACLTAASAMFFRSLGGTFRSVHVCVDLVILTCGVGVTIWLFEVQPLASTSSWTDANLINTVILCFGDGVSLVMMAMMAMRIVEWRAECPLLLVVLATLAGFASDLVWVDRGHLLFQADAWLNAGGFSVYYALLGTAVVLERHHRVPATLRIIENSRFEALPVLSALVATGMLCAPGVDVRHAYGLVLLLVALIATLLVVARQQATRREVGALQEALTRRAAQGQLTALMRQSADLVVVVTADLRLGYASPTSQRLLGIDAQQLVQRQAAQMLGEEHEPRMSQYLTQLMLEPGARGDLELPVLVEGSRRTVQIVGSNQLHNSYIAGIVLTVRDITERRRLEQELVEIAVLERARLAQDIRDSLGSGLERIGHLLAGLRVRELCGGRVEKGDIAEVVSQVNASIDAARRLSMSLSPLNVARGALDVALRMLCNEFSRRFQLRIDLQTELGGDVAGQEADHMFRIAEQILGAFVRGQARDLQMNMCSSPEQLSLQVAGRADASGEGYQALALRLAAYRTHVLGGILRQESREGRWQVEASIPLPA